MRDISAFPQNTKIVAAAGQELHQGFMGGMTLRDYFAAKAMQGLLTIPAKELSNELCDEYPRLDSYISYLSFAMADAMLRAREAKDD